MRILQQKHIVQLLRSEVEKAGGQRAWAKKHGIHRTRVNKILHKALPPSGSIIRALGLRIIVVADRD
jgi:DNA-binding phage protein